MPTILYVNRKLSQSTLRVVAQANAIIERYMADGYRLTLRQLYYQFVSEGLLDNTERNYKRLGKIISEARLCGLVDWDAIEDRSRNLLSNSHWETPQEIVETAARQFALDKWNGQKHRIEVWVEKEALAGVLSDACRTLDVPFFACKGYTSQSEMWRAGMRLRKYLCEGSTPIIVHLGDHDPSGIDMTRDIADRLSLFCGESIRVERIALTIDQVRAFSPPPNPAKLTDSRIGGYLREFGSSSWELDALRPDVLVKLVRDTVLSHRDDDKWDECVREQEQHRQELQQVVDRWAAVRECLEG